MKLVILSFMFLLIFSCSSQEKNVEIIKIDLSNKAIEKAEFNDFFKLKKTILLSNADGFNIFEVSKVQLTSSYVIVLDQQGNQVLIFDLDGKPYAKIKSVGKGPGEYLYLKDFYFNESNNELSLYDNGQNKVCKFSIKGKHLRDEKKGFSASQYYMLNDKEFYFRNNGGATKAEQSRLKNIIVHDKHGSEKSFMSFPVNRLGRSFMYNKYSGGFVTSKDGSILCNEFFSNMIYKYNGTSFIAAYEVIMPNFISEELIEKVFSEQWNYRNYGSELDLFLINIKHYNGSLFFIKTTNQFSTRAYFYNALLKKVYLLGERNLQDKTNKIGLNLVPCKMDLLCAITEPHQLLRLKHLDETSFWWPYINNLDVNDNPILLFYDHVQ